ncbi:MAG: hypothetical protein Tsb002_30190 [Wenzhouxiangellaceae bacterium]
MRYFQLFAMLLMSCGNAFAEVTVSTLTQVFAHGGITVHPQTSDIYIGEFGNLDNSSGTRVARVTSQGMVSTFANNMGLANSGNDFDAQGNLIQASWNSGRLWRVSPGGAPVQLAQTPGPVGVVVAPNGDIYVTTCSNQNQIRRIAAGSSTVQIFATHVGFSCPNGLTMDDRGDLYTVNWNDGQVFRIEINGSFGAVTPIGGVDGGAGHLVFARDRLYIAGRTTNRIYSMTRDGEVAVVAGTGVNGNQDGPAAVATFSRPNGIGTSNDQRFLYVTGSTIVTVPGAGSDNALRVIDLGEEFSFDVRHIEGIWSNPDEPAGQGMMFDYGASFNRVFMTWFTDVLDTLDGAADPQGRQLLTALLVIDGNTLSGPLVINNDDAPATEVGQVSITMQACDAGMVLLTFNDSGQSLDFDMTALEKQVNPDGFVCEEFGQP